MSLFSEEKKSTGIVLHRINNIFVTKKKNKTKIIKRTVLVEKNYAYQCCNIMTTVENTHKNIQQNALNSSIGGYQQEDSGHNKALLAIAVVGGGGGVVGYVAKKKKNKDCQ